MAFRDNIASDYLVWEDLEAVTLRSVANAGDTDTAVTSAKRRAVTTREQAASGGRYTASDLNWFLPVTLLGSVTPKPADVVIDGDSRQWTALDVQLMALRTVWKLTTRDFAIAYSLRDMVDWYEPAPTQSVDVAGHREPTWVPRKLALACRVQEQSAEVVEAFGKMVTQRRYAVWCETRIAPTHEGQLRWTTDAGEVRTLEVTGVTEADRIDALTRVDCIYRGY
jgi:hypothetical protein